MSRKYVVDMLDGMSHGRCCIELVNDKMQTSEEDTVVGVILSSDTGERTEYFNKLCNELYGKMMDLNDKNEMTIEKFLEVVKEYEDNPEYNKFIECYGEGYDYWY